MKKSIYKLLAVFLVVAVVMSSVILTYAADDPTIVVSSAEGIAGSEVTVDISIKNNPGVIAMYLTVAYDDTVMELVGFTALTEVFALTDLYPVNVENNPTRVNFDSLAMANITANGKLVALKFSIKEGASVGDESKVEVSYNVGDIIDFDLNPVHFDVENGSVEVAPRVVSSIAMSAPPTKASYIEGAALDVTGGKITVNYTVGSPDVLDITGAMVTGYSSGTIGTQTLTVTYGGKTTTFPVTVVAKELASIAITTPPTKTAYIEGNTFDAAGMVVTANYNNGTSGVVTGYTVPTGKLALGTSNVTVTYSGKTAVTPITVAAKTLTGISLDASTAKTAYIEGQNLVVTGLTIAATYDNGDVVNVPVTAAMITGYDKNTIGTQTLTVTYEGFTKTFPVTVAAKSLVSIAVTTPPTTNGYIEGNTFNPAGMVVTASYNNDTSEVVTGYTLSHGVLAFGTDKVTVTYNGKTATTPVTVAAKGLSSIVITTPPTKTAYIEGNTFDAAGMVVTANYDNGTSGVVTGYTVPTGKLALGTSNVTVTYAGKTAVTPITVAAKTLTGISLDASTAKTAYIEGQNLVVTGLTIAATYDNGDVVNVPATAAMVAGYDKNTIGTQTLTVAYEGFTKTFPVTVAAKSLVSIAVTTPPTKTGYIEGNTFNPAGMVVTASYNNDTSEVVTGYTLSHGVLAFGTDKVTVTYNGKTAAAPVTVAAKELTGIAVTTPPAKTAYIEGNTFDAAGMVVTASYNNGTSEAVTGYTVPTEKLVLGAANVTITYNGKTAVTPVTVAAKTLESIALDTTTAKTEYLEGDDLVVTGLMIVATYDNGDVTNVPVTAAMVAGYDKDTVGEQTLTVTYDGKTKTYKVTVVSRAAADALFDDIDAVDLDTLTMDDDTVIAALKDRYDALSALEKTAVTNNGKLDEAKAIIFALKNPAIVDAEFEGGDIIVNVDTGVIAFDASLDVKNEDISSELSDGVAEQFGSDSTVLGYYSVSLEDANGDDVDCDSIRLKVKLDGDLAESENLKVVLVKEDGTYEEVDGAAFSDGFVVFTASAQSNYAVINAVADVIPETTVPTTEGTTEAGAATTTEAGGNTADTTKANIPSGQTANVFVPAMTLLAALIAVATIAASKKKASAR